MVADGAGGMRKRHIVSVAVAPSWLVGCADQSSSHRHGGVRAGMELLGGLLCMFKWCARVAYDAGSSFYDCWISVVPLQQCGSHVEKGNKREY